jgi:hypothetical protein
MFDKSYSEITNFIISQLRTPELEENHKNYEKRHLEYLHHFENKNHPTSENW